MANSNQRTQQQEKEDNEEATREVEEKVPFNECPPANCRNHSDSDEETMPILYALVAEGPKVLCEYSENDGNFMQIARQILREVPKGRHRRAYEADEYVFNFSSEDNGLIFLCMTTAGSEARLPWVYMADIRDRFVEQHGGTFQRVTQLFI